MKNGWWVVLCGELLNLVAAVMLFYYGNGLGVVVFMVISAMGGTVSDTASYAVTMSMMDGNDEIDDKEKQYAYIFDVELFYNLGRLTGVLLFLGMSYWWGIIVSLKTVKMVAGILRLGAVWYQYLLRTAITVEVKR